MKEAQPMRNDAHIKPLACGIMAAFALGLGACRVVTHPAGALAPTPQTSATPVFGATTGPVAVVTVTVVVDKSRYAPADTIIATVHNGPTAPIFARNQYSNCTLVSLERWVNGTWQVQAPCRNALPTPHPLKIAPGAVLTQQLAPGQSDYAPDLWQVGTYRIAFAYIASADQPFGQSTVVYSAHFAVG
jgi:hypothetical protein